MVSGVVIATSVVSAKISLTCLAEHIPVPFVYLTLFKSKSFVQLLNLFLGPLWVLLELIQEYLVLNGVLTESLLDLLGTLHSVTDHNLGN